MAPQEARIISLGTFPVLSALEYERFFAHKHHKGLESFFALPWRSCRHDQGKRLLQRASGLVCVAFLEQAVWVTASAPGLEIMGLGS